jgi:hypothetical protein
MIKEQQDQWLSLQEAAERLQKCTRTVERLMKQGEIQSRIFGRPGRRSERLYSASDVERIIEHPVPSKAFKSVAPEIKPGLTDRTKEFAFPLPEGQVLIRLPSQLADSSLADALDFMGLALRQLQRTQGLRSLEQ